MRSLLILFLLGTVACSQEESGERQDSFNSQQAPGPVFGLFVANSGLGDRGFMDSTYQGALEARQKYDALLLMEKQPLKASDQEQAELLGSLVAHGASLVFCSSSSMKQAMDIAARSHPEAHFVLLDSRAETYLPNVSSATFATEQASFLAGALAGKMSRSNALGVIGGVRIPTVLDFVLGFEEGARRVRPSVVVKTVYIEDYDAETIVWNNPAMGWQLAASLHQEDGADIIFPVAGASGIGTFNYVNEKGLFAIGVDTDQDYLAQGRILTSVLKRLDMAVRHLVDMAMAGRLENRNYRFTLADEGVELSEMRYTKELIPDQVHALLDSLRQDIIAGRIVVPSATAVQSGQHMH